MKYVFTVIFMQLVSFTVYSCIITKLQLAVLTMLTDQMTTWDMCNVGYVLEVGWFIVHIRTSEQDVLQ